MAVINIRVSDNEKELIEKAAEFEGKTVTAYLKDLAYDDIEYFEDMKAIKEYEENEGKHEFEPFDEAMKDIGI